MSLALILAIQAAAPAPLAPALPPAAAPIDFDLARFRPLDFGFGIVGRRCDRGDSSAIVVCAPRSAGAYPLGEMAAEFEPRRIVAETGLVGRLTGNVHLQAVEFPGGEVSNRLMVGIRLPF